MSIIENIKSTVPGITAEQVEILKDGARFADLDTIELIQASYDGMGNVTQAHVDAFWDQVANGERCKMTHCLKHYTETEISGPVGDGCEIVCDDDYDPTPYWPEVE